MPANNVCKGLTVGACGSSDSEKSMSHCLAQVSLQ